MTNILNAIAYLLLLDDLEPWIKWGYYASPMSYAQNAIAINEFLDKRWSTVSYTIMFTNSNNHQLFIVITYRSFSCQHNNDSSFSEETVGKVLLKSRSMYTDDYMFWICVIALFAFSFLFNFCFILALTYLNRKLETLSSI